MTELQPSKPAWTRRKKTIVIAAVAVLVFAVPAFAWMFMEMHAASKAFTSFSDALVSKNYERAYNLTSSDFRAALSQSAFADQQTALCSHLGALKKVVIGPSETEGDQHGWSSTISAKFVFERAERQFTFVMKKEGDSWLVYGYKEQ